MEIIRPVSSATGMNSAGYTRPRSGCSQRTNASSPASSPDMFDTLGWYMASSILYTSVSFTSGSPLFNAAENLILGVYVD
jgi:hypothetical protein